MAAAQFFKKKNHPGWSGLAGADEAGPDSHINRRSEIHRPWRQSLQANVEAPVPSRRRPNEDAPPPTPTAARLQYGRMGKNAYIQREHW